MSRTTIGMLALLLLAVSPAAPGQEQGLDTWLGDLSSEDRAVREAAAEELASLGLEAVKPLARRVAGEDGTAAAGARLALEKLAHRASAPGKESIRPAVAAALLSEVSGPYPAKHRQWLLRMVALAAGEECLAGLSKLLGDPDVAEMAVFALSRIPGDASLHAMAKAIDEAPPELKVALVQAIAGRGEPALTPVLMDLVENIHPGVRRAALEGSGDAPGIEPVSLLKKEAFLAAGWESAMARDAYLDLAENLASSGRRDLALSMYEIMFRNGPGVQDRCAGLRGWVEAGAWDVVPVLAELIETGPPALSAVAVELLEERPGVDATRAMVDALAQAPAPLRIKLIRALGRRGDSRALPALAETVDSAYEAIQVAALEALCDLDDPEGAPAMIRAVIGGSDEVRSAAERGLCRITGEEATDAVIRAVKEDPRAGKAGLVKILGVRRDQRAYPALRAALEDPESDVRLAAVQALGYMDSAGAAESLIPLLAYGDERERDDAKAALARMRGREATSALIDAFEGAPDMTRAGIVTALGRRKDASLGEFFREASTDPCLDVAAAALDAMGRLQDPSLVPRLLEAAKSEWPEERAAAVRAYVMVGEGVAPEDRTRALKIYQEALELSDRDDERVLALSRLGNLDDPDALPVIRPYLAEGSERVKKAAADAASPLAMRLANDAAWSERAAEVLEAVVKNGGEPNRVQEAASKLRELGREVDVPVQEGCIKHYWVIGPFAGREDLRKTDPVPAGGPEDLSEEVEYRGEKYRWAARTPDHFQGMLNLLLAVADRGNAGAYAYARVMSDRDQEAQLEIGSDDDVYCWLNGELVHQWEGGRGWSAGQDTVKVHLESGLNRILFKVLNGGGGWAVSCRILDSEGDPLVLEQVRE
jgi:HEAT repeat protein